MNTSLTIEVLVADYRGGRGSLYGGALAVFPLIFFVERLLINLVNLPGLHLVIFGLLLILVTIYYPGGIAELLRSIQRRLKRAST